MKKALLVLAVLALGFVAFVATRPSHFQISRTTAVRAPADVIYAQVVDFHQWAGWSPWDKLDPAQTRTFGGADRGVGATYAWAGNSKVGTGTMAVTDARPSSRIVVALDFETPMKAHNTSTFTFLPHGEGTTLVTWSMAGDNGFAGKAFGVFTDMDKMVGGDFERGLESLKIQSEAEEKKAAQERKAEEAKQAAAAAAAQPTPDAGVAKP